MYIVHAEAEPAIWNRGGLAGWGGPIVENQYVKKSMLLNL